MVHLHQSVGVLGHNRGIIIVAARYAMVDTGNKDGSLWVLEIGLEKRSQMSTDRSTKDMNQLTTTALLIRVVVFLSSNQMSTSVSSWLLELEFFPDAPGLTG